MSNVRYLQYLLNLSQQQIIFAAINQYIESWRFSTITFLILLALTLIITNQILQIKPNSTISYSYLLKYMTDFVQSIKRTKTNILHSVQDMHSVIANNLQKNSISALQQILSTIATFDQNQINSVAVHYRDEEILKNIKTIVDKINQKNTASIESVPQKKQIQKPKQILKPQERKQQNTIPKPTKVQSNNKSSGLFGMLGFLKKNQKSQAHQMILPQDTPPAKYDPIKKKWIFEGQQEEPQKQIPKPPPRLQGTKSAQSSILASTKTKQKSQLDQMTAPPSFKRKGTSTKQKKTAPINIIQNKQQEKPISFVQEQNNILDSLMNLIDKEFYSLSQTFHAVQKHYREQAQIQIKKRTQIDSKMKKMSIAQSVKKPDFTLQLTKQQCNKLFSMNQKISQVSKISDQMLDVLRQVSQQQKTNEFTLMNKILSQIQNGKIINKVFMNQLKSTNSIQKEKQLQTQTKLTVQSQQFRRLEAQLQKTQKEISEYITLKSNLQDKLAKETYNKHLIVSQNQHLKTKIQTLQVKLSQADKNISKMLSTSTQNIVAQRQKQRQRQMQRQLQKQRLEALNSKNISQELQFLSMKVIDEQKKVSQVQKQREELQIQIERLTKINKQLQARIKQLLKKQQLAKNQYQGLRQTNESLINQNQELNDKLNAQIQNREKLFQTLKRLELQIQVATKEKINLQNSLRNHSAVDQDTINAHFEAMSNFAQQLSKQSQLLQIIQNKRAAININNFSDESSSSHSSSKKSNEDNQIINQNYINQNTVFNELSEIISEMTKCYMKKMGQMKSQMMILQNKNQLIKQNMNKQRTQFVKQNESLNKSIGILQSMNNTYRKSKKDNQQKISLLQVQNETLKKKLLHLKHEEQFNKQMIEKTLKTSQVHDESITLLKGDKQQLQLRIDNLQSQIYYKQQSIVQLQSKLEHMIQEIQKSEQALSQKQNQYRSLKQLYKKQNISYQQTLHRKESALKSIQQESSQKYKSLTKSYNQLLQKYQRELKNRDNFTDKYSHMQNQFKMLKKVSKQKEETIEQLNKSVTKSQRDVQWKQSQYKNRMAILQNSQRQLHQLNYSQKQQIIGLTDQLYSVNNEKETLEQLVQQINRQNQKLQKISQSQVTELNNQLQVIKKSHNSKQLSFTAQRQSLLHQISQLKIYTSKSQSQFNLLNQSFANLTEQHQQLQELIAQTLDNFRQFQKDQNQIKEFLTSKIQFLNSQLSNSYEESINLSQQISEYTNLVQTLDQKLNVLVQQLHRQKEQHQKQKTSNQELLELVLNLQAKANDYQTLQKQFQSLDQNYKSLYYLYDKNERLVQIIQNWISQMPNTNGNKFEQEQQQKSEQQKLAQSLQYIQKHLKQIQTLPKQDTTKLAELNQQIQQLNRQKLQLQEILNVVQEQKRTKIEEEARKYEQLQRGYDYMNIDFIRISNENKDLTGQYNRILAQKEQILQRQTKLAQLIESIQRTEQQKIDQLNTKAHALKYQNQRLVQSQNALKLTIHELERIITQLKIDKTQMEELIVNMNQQSEEDHTQKDSQNSEIISLTQQLTVILNQNQSLNQKIDQLQSQKYSTETLLKQKQLLITQLTQQFQKTEKQQAIQRRQSIHAQEEANKQKLININEIVQQLSFKLQQCQKAIAEKDAIIQQYLQTIREKELEIVDLTDLLAGIQQQKESQQKIAINQSSQDHLRIKELQTQLKTLHSEKQDFLIIIQQQQSQISSLKQLLEVKNRQLLKDKNEQLQNQKYQVYERVIQKFKEQVQNQQEIIEKLEQDLNNSNEEIQNSKMYEEIIMEQKEKEKSEEQNETTTAQIKQAGINVDNGQAQTTGQSIYHEQLLRKLQQQLSDKNDQILQMNQLVTSQQSQIEELAQKIKIYQVQLQELKSQAKADRKYHITNEQQTQILNLDIKLLEQSQLQLQRKVEILNQQNQINLNKIQQHIRIQHQLKSKIKQLADQLSMKDQDTMEMNQLITSQQSEVQQLAQKIKKYESEMVLLQQKLEQTQEKVNILQTQKQLSQKLKGQQNSIQNQQQGDKALQQELKQTYEDLRNHKIQIDELRINLNQVNRLFSERQNKYQDKILSLQKQISSYTNVKNKIKSMQEKYIELQAQNVQMSTEKVQLLRLNNKLELENISYKRKLGISDGQSFGPRKGPQSEQNNNSQTKLRQTKSQIMPSNENVQAPKPTGFFGSISSLFLTPIQTDRMTKSTVKK